MPEDNDAETSDRGMLEGGGSGGGSERVEENRPEAERGGSRWALYIVIALVIAMLAWPVVRIFAAASESPFLTWLYIAVLLIALAIAIPFLYGLLKRST